jgi:cell pole-organizing protein PopZ
MSKAGAESTESARIISEASKAASLAEETISSANQASEELSLSVNGMRRSLDDFVRRLG